MVIPIPRLLQLPCVFLLLSACSDSSPTSQTQPQAPSAAISNAGFALDPSTRHAFFGELHIHTAMSFDAASAATRTTPDQAYKFAQGQPVEYFGRTVKRNAPLDFMAVTDHAEYLSVAVEASDPQGRFANTDWPSKLQEASKNMVAFLRIFSPGGFRGETPIPEFVDESLIRNNWQRQLQAAQDNYHPGTFTTFVAYEWSPMPGGAHLHRNVIFRGPDYPERPFTAIDSLKPEDLWTYAESNIAAGKDLVLIPHNSNLSEGLMFSLQDSYGQPLTAAYAARRTNLERLVEISQIKGTSETRPEFSPTDEFANFELINFGANKPNIDLRGAYVRTAMKRGLELQNTLGSNPFTFGLVGSSDFHSGLSTSEENNFPGGLGDGDEQSDPQRVLTSVNPLMGSPTTVMSASGLTGVWAEANNREALFAALKRREVFATSGNRMQLRLFAGWDYSAPMLTQPNWITTAYATGVPMGTELPRNPPGKSPVLILQATKDPDAGNIDRIQVVKVWLQDGEAQEKIYDALWGDSRVPTTNGHLPALPSTVDLSTATYSNSTGSASLLGLWCDPDFSPTQAAIYYARALEISTPRWTTYLAVKNALPLSPDVPAEIQERAWSSPIFYNP